MMLHDGLVPKSELDGERSPVKGSKYYLTEGTFRQAKQLDFSHQASFPGPTSK